MVTLLERERFQPNHQAQQPRRELLRAPRLRRVHRLLVDRTEGVRLGDAAGHAIDHSHLFGVKIAIAVRLPDSWHVS